MNNELDVDPPCVYDGRDVRVFAHAGPGELLVVTFTKFTKHPPAALFATSFLAKNQIPFIAFQSQDNHWWQTPEMDEAIDRIRPLLAGRDRIYTYGSSMGANGALMFSKALGATRVIAVAPQYSIHPDIMPEEFRWPNEASRVGRLYEPDEAICPKAEKVIVYDPFCGPDAVHAERILKLPNTMHLKISLGGHAPLQLVRGGGMLSKLMGILFAPELRMDAARELCRQARRTSPAYRLAYALRKYGRRNPQRALEIAEPVIDANVQDDPDVLLSIARIYRRVGNLRKARDFAKASLAVTPNIKNVAFTKAILEELDPSAAPDVIEARLIRCNLNRKAKIQKFLAMVPA